MSTQVQAIVVREVHEAREDRATGVGQSPDATYNQITPLLIEIIGYFDQIVQQNPNDLLAPRMANLMTQLQGLVGQYNDEVVVMVKTLSDRLAVCQATSAQASTALQQSQAQASSGVSPQAAAGIAVASALVGGLAGYAVRGKL